MTGPVPPGLRTYVPICSEADLSVARRCVRELGVAQGLAPPAIAALATAVTEIARNIVVHASGGGEMTLTTVAQGQRRGIAVVLRDDGPGITDVAQAMEDGFSTGGGLGFGLPGAQRLVDEFHIESGAGRGTTVTLRQWTPPAREAPR